MKRLIVFDVDGTLAKIYTLHLLPRVQDFFRLVYNNCVETPKIAIATNQGGVGMRYWMEQEGWGKPHKYPTVDEIEERLRGLVEALGAPIDLPVYVAFRYKNREGQWAPVPPEYADDPRWEQDWRKPLPGMLLQAMRDANAAPQETLFVGDSEDDRGAAAAAGCAFEWAESFFSRDWRDCNDLGEI